MKKPVAEAHATRHRDDFSYQGVADEHVVWRSSLARPLNEVCVSNEDQPLKQRVVSPRGEELAVNIKEFVERHLLPTRQMVKNLAAPVIGKKLCESRLARFLSRNKDTPFTASW
jgi:hypothetical protein